MTQSEQSSDVGFERFFDVLEDFVNLLHSVDFSGAALLGVPIDYRHLLSRKLVEPLLESFRVVVVSARGLTAFKNSCSESFLIDFKVHAERHFN